MRDTLDLGPLLIDFGSRRLEWHGQQVALSRQLFELLGVLALHAGQPVAVDALITAICAKRFGTADDVYHAVNRLRKVLDDHGHIRNRRGFGYMFVPDEPEATELESSQKAPAAAQAS
jgi:DNA-binding response OmpR family regulator